MNIYADFRDLICKALAELEAKGDLPGGLDFSRVTAEPPREATHGDISTNAAMVLAKPAQMSPRALAKRLAPALEALPAVKGVEIAGPGFINCTLAEENWRTQLTHILKEGTSYGDSTLGQGEKVNVEYVSVNPTGPVHVGHSRSAVVGDVLASLLEKVGYAVTREYYINDAGTQVDKLARSAYARYLEALGQDPGNIGEYPGEYLIPVGTALAKEYGTQWVGQPEEAWLPPLRAFAVGEMMALIRKDLEALAVHHDVFTSERALVESGLVDEVFETLQKRGVIYEGTLPAPKGKPQEDWEPRVQTLFKSTDFGDDVDRPLKKSDGSWTYLMPDIAYHYDKYKRGFCHMIDLLGADHGGYVKRITAATKAISNEKADLHVMLCDLVQFKDQGEAMKMSKRAGTFIAVRDVLERVGRDVLRFIMITRKNEAGLDFDFAKVVEHSRDNPVFYVQYAHARAHSVMRHVVETFPNFDLSPKNLQTADVTLLTDASDIAMMKKLAGWPRQVELAAMMREPHRLAFYLYEIAAEFHMLWNKGKDKTELRFVHPENETLTTARLALVQAVAFVIASGLRVIGVTPVKEMR